MTIILRNTLLGAALVTLTACATTPSSDLLFTGLNASPLDKNTTAAVTKLSASDPTCVTFYENAVKFQTEASKPNPGANILSSVALTTLASVATLGIAGAGIGSTLGQVAAQSAAQSATLQAGSLALKGLKQNNPARAKIQSAADQLGCPVSFT